MGTGTGRTFSKDVVSIEPENSKALKTAKGIAAIKQKAKDFNAMVEKMHDGWCSEPIVAGNFIAVAMGMDVTMKGAGRSKMDEIAVYEVKQRKIVKRTIFLLTRTNNLL